jgi:hypothetical protein
MTARKTASRKCRRCIVGYLRRGRDATGNNNAGKEQARNRKGKDLFHQNVARADNYRENIYMFILRVRPEILVLKYFPAKKAMVEKKEGKFHLMSSGFISCR